MVRNETVESDVLVIGGGAAGLVTAFVAASAGKKVILLSRGRPGKACNTVLSNGYFRCATGSYTGADHRQDTLKSGRKINNKRLVDALVDEAPSALKRLVQSGMPGRLQEKGLNAHLNSLFGGPDLTPALVRICAGSSVRFIDAVTITDLVVQDGICRGATGIGPAGEGIAFSASSVVLATGGAAGIFRFNDNAPGSHGDGYALAIDAGLDLVDMEFVQFYPLIRADNEKRRMLLPASFADPAVITNSLGEDIKEKHRLFSGSVARLMRDRFSRAIFEEVRAGNGVDGAVLMDMRQIRKEDLPISGNLFERFENILGFTRAPVKIAPAAHFTMGGIRTDTEGRTTLEGLYAVGEVAGGLHGANRAGGNALSETVVFGTRCGKALLGDTTPPLPRSRFDFSAGRLLEERFKPASTLAKEKPSASLKALRDVMWNKAGIIRSESGLKQALSFVDRILESTSLSELQSVMDLRKRWALRAASITSRAMIVSALERTESRGAHFREDYPEESELWIRNIYTAADGSGRPEISRIETVN